MAQADWKEVTGSAATASIERGVDTSGDQSLQYAGAPSPNVYRYTSLDNGTGCVASYLTLPHANPTAKGASISAALQRGLSAGQTDFSVFVFAQLTNPSVSGVAYMLGLGDGGRIVLRKGSLAGGLPSVAPGSQGVLARSSLSYPDQAWYHLQLECVANGNGDVVINAYMSDLSLYDVGAPNWVQIPGIERVIDDPAGIVSGSPSLRAGRLGFGFRSADVARVALVNSVRPIRQV